MNLTVCVRTLASMCGTNEKNDETKRGSEMKETKRSPALSNRMERLPVAVGISH